MFDATADRSAILFQLSFTGSARANSSPLAREAEAAALQPWKSVAQLSELNLQTSSGACCSLGKNIEDQFTAIHHWAVNEQLQIPGLNGRQFPICDHEGGLKASRFERCLL
jgi:hypothetical protein